ncbi:neurofilament medium polypeptide [Callorhinchus milii]|uniref:neurofilament medium polypeptide n=1 Tax=Callorhinchus milii TaxID=7868 RepID=UPI001C3FF55D|nr:neurofilament medium polypeptide [Callorhinchus milii]
MEPGTEQPGDTEQVEQLATPADQPSQLDTSADQPSQLDTPADQPSQLDTPANQPSQLDTPADQPSQLDTPADQRSQLATPAETDQTEQPSGPSEPAQVAQPAIPDDTAQLEQPTETDQPSQPGDAPQAQQPRQPAKPDEKTQPNQTVKPGEAAVRRQPDRPPTAGWKRLVKDETSQTYSTMPKKTTALSVTSRKIQELASEPCILDKEHRNAIIFRNNELSEPKKLHKGFELDKPSPIWPVKNLTTKSLATERVNELAKPKYVSEKWEPDRSFIDLVMDAVFIYSVAAHDGITSYAIPRFMYLSEPKAYHKDYEPNRPSPIWPVPESAMKVVTTQKTRELAQPRVVNKDWKQDRSPYSEASVGPNVPPSFRLQKLAEPKTYSSTSERPAYMFDNQYVTQVSPAAKYVTATPRLVELSKPKGTHKDFVQNKPMEQPVSPYALTYEAGERTKALAVPRKYVALAKENDIFQISEAAKHAVASQRTLELAAPLPRKVTPKKIT